MVYLRHPRHRNRNRLPSLLIQYSQKHQPHNITNDRINQHKSHINHNHNIHNHKNHIHININIMKDPIVAHPHPIPPPLDQILLSQGGWSLHGGWFLHGGWALQGGWARCRWIAICSTKPRNVLKMMK